MKAVENYKKKNYKKFEPLDTQQLINFDLDDLEKFLETNSNVNKQDKENNHTDARNKNYMDKQQFDTQESIDFGGDLEQFLKNRNDLKTLEKVKDLIKKKTQMNNPYINHIQGTQNNSKQFDKELSFDDEMCNLESSQGDKNPNYQTNDMFEISGTNSSFDDISINEKNDDEMFDYVFSHPQDDRIDFSEFNEKGTKNILIEDNDDKTNNIAALYHQAIKKFREHESLTKQEIDAIRLVDEYTNILDENDQSTHKKTNKFTNKAKYNDNKQYHLENNTLYQGFNMSKYDIQKNKFSNNNNYKKKKKPVNANNLNKNKRMKSLSDQIRENNAKKMKKKHFNANNLNKNNRMKSLSDQIRENNAKKMKKQHFNANAHSWCNIYKKNPISVNLMEKTDWLNNWNKYDYKKEERLQHIAQMKSNKDMWTTKDIKDYANKYGIKI